MGIPNLQIALDHSDLPSAVADIAKVGEIVDILEVGTILCLQAGEEAIRCVRALFPNKKVVADTKCADAGGTVAKNCADAGADWMTVICCATIPTMKAAAKEVEEVQVELYGDWTYEQAQQWLDAGISQAIYHQSRDALFAGETWGEKDLNRVKKLIEMGFRVSVTGGLDVDTLKLFAGVDVYTFITGRGITAAEDPVVAAQAFKAEIQRIWG
ncbi:3-dehydro-L-gulonate-6-phosphate decarboxylase [Enterococcus sp. PF1-24]|uniref:3-keto-L-gulonate-6-phosphate decarboxylase UlaD n=1 Tax=unclassified Enterococcus TaxID=2608891 RepID=UPI00247662B2|nr:MULTISPECIES: 3-keto-L-gulonate-6-phosphate decarboxylase UlaD [unclassified Enterococcus]MDH6363935.1 3-dehydro-L-gulonate-6-phosphate decarboxylase [Enterococcus sp. PFB1-1]MDH6401036.1 3-dehydro-L-gulonate-6-phosphate decarboxylase [Enterococcus sp. PF1-24]